MIIDKRFKPHLATSKNHSNMMSNVLVKKRKNSVFAIATDDVISAIVPLKEEQGDDLNNDSYVIKNDIFDWATKTSTPKNRYGRIFFNNEGIVSSTHNSSDKKSSNYILLKDEPPHFRGIDSKIKDDGRKKIRFGISVKHLERLSRAIGVREGLIEMVVDAEDQSLPIMVSSIDDNGAHGFIAPVIVRNCSSLSNATTDEIYAELERRRREIGPGA